MFILNNAGMEIGIMGPVNTCPTPYSMVDGYESPEAIVFALIHALWADYQLFPDKKKEETMPRIGCGNIKSI